MSTQFRNPPHAFVKHDNLRLSSVGVVEQVEPEIGGNCAKPIFRKQPAVPLRDDHIVLFAIDALITLRASFKKWRNRRLTLRALADLGEHQLHDIGLTRDENGYRALTEINETRRCEQHKFKPE
jgi:uncharacterized protein YjiS (DUF1127 family)